MCFEQFSNTILTRVQCRDLRNLRNMPRDRVIQVNSGLLKVPVAQMLQFRLVSMATSSRMLLRVGVAVRLSRTHNCGIESTSRGTRKSDGVRGSAKPTSRTDRYKAVPFSNAALNPSASLYPILRLRASWRKHPAEALCLVSSSACK